MSKNITKKIFLDAGHGGRDSGAFNQALNLRESDIALEVSQNLAAILTAAGFDVKQSRTTDVFITIDERWRAANAWGADCFISIHANAGGGTGAETFIAATKQNNRIFAQTVNDTYAAAMGLRNRGVKLDSTTRHGSLGVLRHSSMPAILVELAFIDSPTHKSDLNILQFKRDVMAESLAKGIFKYFMWENTLADRRDDIEKSFTGIPTTPIQTYPPSMVKFCLDGEETEIEGYIDNGVTWVKARQLLENLGYVVGWDSDAGMVTVEHRGGIPHTTEELEYLQQIVHFEARGEDLKGQILVANVVLNRVESEQFPNSIIEVIKDNRINSEGNHVWQFTPVGQPDFGTATPSKRTIQAVAMALDGVDDSQGALWFNGTHLQTTSWAAQNRTHIFNHGGHSFYV